jgi:hypothetical protein
MSDLSAIAVESSTAGTCMWCGAGFAPRTTGGSRQAFCRTRCRRDFDAACRAYARAALASGSVTVSDLKNGHTPARALIPDTALPAEVSRHPSSAVPVDGSVYEDIVAILLANDPVWAVVDDAIPDPLFERLQAHLALAAAPEEVPDGD